MIVQTINEYIEEMLERISNMPEEGFDTGLISAWSTVRDLGNFVLKVSLQIEFLERFDVLCQYADEVACETQTIPMGEMIQ